MGADNWAECPVCRARQVGESDAVLRLARATYGKVSQEAFLEALGEANKRMGEILSRDVGTFREDYEIGINQDGDFGVSYTGGCEACGAKFEFRHRVEKVVAG